MKRIIFILFAGIVLTSCNIETNDTKNIVLNEIKEVDFKSILNEWKIKSYNNGDYAKPENCNLDYVIANEDKSNVGIPNEDEIDQFILDYNNDGLKDCLYIFTPIQCEGGNALMYLQTAILILSDKEKNYITNDTLLSNLFSKLESGNISITGISNNEIIGK